MARTLHLLKAGDTTLARAAIGEGLAAGDRISVVLLPGAGGLEVPAGVVVRRVPDDLSWDALLELIFEADQVVAW